MLRDHLKKTAIASSGNQVAVDALGRGDSQTTKPYEMLEWVLAEKAKGRKKPLKSPFLEVQEPSMLSS
jgi:hypothetical protein